MIKEPKMKLLNKTLILVLQLSLLVSCGVFIGNPGDQTDSTPVKGSAVLGPIANADIIIYGLDELGNRVVTLAQTTTDADGNYNSLISYDGIVEVVARGGSYNDEATGENVDRTDAAELRTIVSEIPEGYLGVNALTTIAATIAVANASGGLEDSLIAANAQIASMFDIEDIDFVATKPDDLTTEDDEGDATLGVLMAGFSQMAKDNKLNPADLDKLIDVVAEDFKDGVIDQKNNGKSISSDLPINSEDALGGFTKGLKTFIEGDQNKSNVTVDDAPSAAVTSVFEGEWQSACLSSPRFDRKPGVQVILKVTGNRRELSYKYFEESTCNLHLQTYRYVDIIQDKKLKKGSSDVYDIDTFSVSASLSMQTTEAVNAANNEVSYGYENWLLGEEKNIAGRSFENGFNQEKLKNDIRYLTNRVSGNSLYLGTGEADDIDERPALDSSGLVLIKQ
jgi:hypothetical protein